MNWYSQVAMFLSKKKKHLQVILCCGADVVLEEGTRSIPIRPTCSIYVSILAPKYLFLYYEIGRCEWHIKIKLHIRLSTRCFYNI